MYQSFTFDYFPPQFYMQSSGDGSVVLEQRRNEERAQGTPSEVVAAQISFASLVAKTSSRMQSGSSPSAIVPPIYALRKSNNGKITLEAFEWVLQIDDAPIAELRMVYIQGAKNQIINTWIFPNRPARMPVFAAELIAVGAETRVAFVDIQIPALEETTADDVSLITGSISPRFAGLPCNEQPPVWAIHASQGNFTYARNVPSTQSHRIEECYLSYLDAYLTHFCTSDVSRSIAQSKRDEAALNELQRYQWHHMEHSPGNKFLGKLFGSDWTEAFMKDFLFSKPRG